MLVSPEDTTSSMVDVPSERPRPALVRLLSSPNPFTVLTRLDFALPRAEDVRVAVFDISGRLVRRVHSGRLDAGAHRFEWNGRDDGGRRCRGGIDLVRVERGGAALRTKVVLLK